jgi:ribosome-binding ATPase
MAQLPIMEASLKLLQEGKPVRTLLSKLDADELRILQSLNLLTSHPVLYVCNVAESDAATGNEHTRAVEKMAREQGAETVVISAAIESEVAQLPEEEAKEFLAALGLEEAGLDRLIRAGYHLLDLITYFTVGPKETRAWTIVRGTKAPAAAGVIHTDFERGFIRAFTIGFDDYIAFKGEVGAKEAGKGRDEGKEYVVHDGDVIHFRFNT